MSKISVIIPTMQKDINILNILVDELVEDTNVGEIIIIDNSLKGYIHKSDKINVFLPDKNMYVNPSWNYGIKISNYEYFAILNDDLILPSNLCKQIIEFIDKTPNCGVIGLESSSVMQVNNLNYNQYTEESNLLFKPINNIYSNSNFFWGSAIFGKKENYYTIPDEMLIYSGDNYLIFKNKKNKKQNYAISNIKVFHCGSLTSSNPKFNPIKTNDMLFFCKLDKDYRRFKQKQKKEQIISGITLNKLERLFSIKNSCNKKYKIITIFNIKFIKSINFSDKEPNSCKRKPIEYIFSVKNSNNKEQKIITILGLKIKRKNYKKLFLRDEEIIKNNKKLLRNKTKEIKKYKKIVSENKSNIKILKTELISKAMGKHNYEAFYKYILPINTIKKIIDNDNIKIVSFDIFDTLLIRPCIFPTDIFYLIANKINHIYNIDFIDLRLNVEQKLGNIYANIDEIYDFIEKEYQLEHSLAEKIKQEELLCEKQLLTVRNDIKEIYEYAKSKGKKIIAISDMYLSSDFLKNILINNGYKDISYIYISNEINARKDIGNLYDFVIKKENVKPSQICHIGDNYESDYKVALNKYITAIYYPSIKNIVLGQNSIYKDIFPKDISNDPIVRILLGYTFNQLFKDREIAPQGPSLFTNIQDFIKLCICPVLFYIAHFISTNSNIQTNYNTVYFAARDGYLPQIAYDIISNHISKECIPSKYIYAGRRAYFSLINENIEDFINRYIKYINKDINLKDILNAFITDKQLLSKIYNNIPPDILNYSIKENHKECFNELNKFKEDINEYEKKHKNNAILYYQSQIKQITEENIIFDIGYSGTIGDALYTATGKKWNKIYLWQKEENQKKDKLNETYTIELFNRKRYSNNLLYEEIFSPLEGSCLGFREDHTPIIEDISFSEEMKNDYKTIKETLVNYLNNICSLFQDYVKYLTVTNSEDLQEILFYMLSKSPYLEASIFKNIIFKDGICYTEAESLESKIYTPNRKYEHVFQLTGFNNPSNYIEHIKLNKDNYFNPKVAIHLHLYNLNLSNEILNYLKNFPYKFDLLITTIDINNKHWIENIFNKNIIENLNNLFVIETINRGRDVSPWLIGTKEYQTNYDLFCHIHSKESKHFGNMAINWRRYLYNNLISKQAVINIFELFKQDKNIGCVFPKEYYEIANLCINKDINPEGKDGEIDIIRNLSKKMEIKRRYCKSNIIFSAGTMMWYRPNALKPLFDLNLSYEDFPEEPIEVGGTIAHAIERLPSFVCNENGYKTVIYNQEQ